MRACAVGSPAGYPRAAMHSTTPSALDLAELFFRRTAPTLRALQGTLPPSWHATVRALGRFAKRHGAQGVDVLVHDEVAVALDLAGRDVPVVSQRLARAVTQSTGLPLRVQEGTLLRPAKGLRDERAVEGVVRVGRWYLARTRSFDDDLRRDLDVEAVHQTRVALRRLRCLLRALRPHANALPWLGDAEAWVRGFGERAGAVRDLDVSVALIATQGLAPDALDAATSHLAALRTQQRTALVAALDDAGLNAGCLAFSQGLDALGRPKGALRRVAQAHFNRELRGLRRALDGDLSSAEGFHAVRRRARRVRDAVEVFGGALPRGARAWRARLQGIQGMLGALNDTSVALAAFASGSHTVQPARDALERRRITLLAELATPMALLVTTLDRAR